MATRVTQQRGITSMRVSSTHPPSVPFCSMNASDAANRKYQIALSNMLRFWNRQGGSGMNGFSRGSGMYVPRLGSDAFSAVRVLYSSCTRQDPRN